MVSVLIVTIWKSLGWTMIFYMEAIRKVPQNLLESAAIDGANGFWRFVKITLPLISPTILFLVIMSTISSLQAYDQIQVLTQGGPAGATRTLLYYYYQEAFQNFNTGKASAVAVILVIITVVLSLAETGISKKMVFDSQGGLMRRKSGIRNLLIHIGLASISFILAFPFLWMFTNSIKTKAEIWAVPPRVLPAVAQWNNYADALGDGTFLMYMWNSTYTAVLITVIMLFNSAMFAYALTNIRFKGKTILTALIMVTYIMPATTTYVPSYVILSRMGLMNTHLGYMLSSCASIFNIFFLRTTFSQITPGIVEAARIDGAGHWKILWWVLAPVSRSAFMTLGLLSFLGCYNSYLWPSLLLRRKEKYLVSMGLQAFFTAEGAYGLKWGTIMAACCVTVFPLLILFLFGQRWILNGITSDSAVKG